MHKEKFVARPQARRADFLEYLMGFNAEYCFQERYFVFETLYFERKKKNASTPLIFSAALTALLVYDC